MLLGADGRSDFDGLRSRRHGLGVGSLSGQAILTGPTFYLQIAKGMALSEAWNMQVKGRIASGGSLDLVHFERQQAKVRFNVNF